MATLVQCEGCGNQVSKKAVSCPGCGHPTKAKHVSAGGVLMAFLGLALFLWWLAPSGSGKVFMDDVHKQVVQDSIDKYEIARRSGDAMQICVNAGMVTAAHLQAQDESGYQTWLAREKKDCTAAGVPR